MKHVHLDDAPEAALSGEPDRRALDDALGTSNLALKYYDLDPGEAFSGGFHTHTDQEELFVVLEGEATWDTEEGEAAVTVRRGEALRFAPGEFQHGYASADGDGVRALAIGAPPGMEGTVTRFRCRACSEETDHDVDLDAEHRRTTTTCRACGNELVTDLDG